MNEILTKSIETFKESRHIFEHEFAKRNKELTEQAKDILVQAMKYHGLDEVLLFLMTPDGEAIDDWCEDEDFVYDENDSVDYTVEEVGFGKVEEDYQDKRIPTITRFGLKDGELVCHMTTTTIHNMGDLDLVGLDRDDWREPWIPIAKLGENRKMQNLILKCVSSPGNWAFTKQHPECCFLHRTEE